MAAGENLHFNRILFQYDLVPLRMDPLGNVIKVETANGTFALKQKKLTDRQIRHLHKAYSLAGRLIIDAVGPLPSKYGDLVVRGEENSYYLMPWFEETVPDSDLSERYRHLFVRSAQLHRQTLQEEKDASDLFATAAQMVGARQIEWERFLNRAEHRVYPSPFEQCILSFTADGLNNMQRAFAYFSKGQEKNEDGSGKKLRRALCHGRLSPLHLLIEGEKSFLCNFEESEEDFFIIETAALFEQASVMLSPAGESWNRLLHSYFSECPLNEEESEFLFHLLLCPKAPLDLIGEYEENRGHSEQWYTKRWMRLSRAYTEMTGQLQQLLDQKKKKEEEAKKEEEQVKNE
ncbi:spore coat protein YsxE [Sporolactobacillus putidus]|uniref:Spore coat protein YsxE n=1 Tax=Sporolactobacillus putidus TaxID=492735 RepID=A0A917VZ25_9BACL|nr:spore coat protein YsxE [Sporolactobacillus putidus]GGL41316.1 spore coat protein YsxE [Sporolactobacillus putidus]